jgi:hypothetical protein
MSIVSLESADEKNVSASILNFLTAYGGISLLSNCGGTKLKGVPVKALFTYTLTNVFRMGSFYMQNKLGKIHDGFSKNTYYRFLMSPRTNWLRFTTLLSARIINGHLRDLTSENRDDCFVIDDSLYERAGFKRTELASRVFDHVSMRFKKGFRLLTLGWTDGCTFLPINYSLLASNDDEKVLGPCNKIDRRTIAGKRRLMARQKATSVMVDLLKTALAAGHKAKYVLFDSWFSNPQQLLDIKKLGLNTIAMVKRSSKRFYIFEGKSMDIKKIFATNKKRRGRSRYLLSVTVKVGQDKNGENGIDARIVCVRNRNNRKDWIAIICTDMSLSENDIIRIYGHRWDIEVFFKTCKSSLLLRKEYHGLSYDGLTAHVAMVFTRYMLLAVSKRDNEDDRTLGELFYIMISEVADITYHESMQIIVEAMLATVQEEFHIADAQVETFYAKFMSKLPESMQRLLQAA